ncbi:hypothetical protein SVIOM342S_08001 [Streptomyces violaceorubidus]
MHVVPAEGAPLADGQPALPVHTFAEFEGLPAVGGQPGGERVLLQLARGRDEGAHGVGVVVPAGARAGRPADQPGLAAARPSRRTQVRPSGSSGREAISSASAAARRTKSRSSAWVGAAVGAGWVGGRREGRGGTRVPSWEFARERAAARPSGGAREEGGRRFSRTDDTRSPHSGRGPYGPSATGAHRCQSRSGVDHDGANRSTQRHHADSARTAGDRRQEQKAGDRRRSAGERGRAPRSTRPGRRCRALLRPPPSRPPPSPRPSALSAAA